MRRYDFRLFVDLPAPGTGSKDFTKALIMHIMSIGMTTRRHLALAVVLAVFLLGARFALSTHSYEHELDAPVADCELCDFGHVSSDGAVVDNRADLKLPQLVLAIDLTGWLLVANRPRVFLPRAPPFSSNHS